MPGKQSGWTKNYRADLYPVIELGDLVELDLHPYRHFCVYIGNGYLVHNSDSQGKVVKEYYESMKYYGCNARINNWADGDTRFSWSQPYDGAEIVRRAESKIGEGPFDKITNNCEHFANWCRYGERYSPQLEEARARRDRGENVDWDPDNQSKSDSKSKGKSNSKKGDDKKGDSKKSDESSCALL